MKHHEKNLEILENLGNLSTSYRHLRTYFKSFKNIKKFFKNQKPLKGRGKIKKVKTAVLVKNKMVETPEGTVSQPISDEDKEKITSLVKEAVGFNEDREDSIVVTSGDFIQEMDVISKKLPAELSIFWPPVFTITLFKAKCPA